MINFSPQIISGVFSHLKSNLCSRFTQKCIVECSASLSKCRAHLQSVAVPYKSSLSSSFSGGGGRQTDREGPMSEKIF